MNSLAYIRLRTPSLSLLTPSLVYLGADHLLVMDCSGFEERYRRFFYTDIQAIVIRKTASGRVMNLVLGFFSALFLIGAAALGNEGLVILGAVGVLLLILLVVNVVQGPTCAVFIKTRVQLHRVKAFSRLASTHRCVEDLFRRIQQAQASLGPSAAVSPDSVLTGRSSVSAPESSGSSPSAHPTGSP